MLRLGIDLGGTKIAGVVLGPDGASVAEHRMASPRQDYAATIRLVRLKAQRFKDLPGWSVALSLMEIHPEGLGGMPIMGLQQVREQGLLDEFALYSAREHKIVHSQFIREFLHYAKADGSISAVPIRASQDILLQRTVRYDFLQLSPRIFAP